MTDPARTAQDVLGARLLEAARREDETARSRRRLGHRTRAAGGPAPRRGRKRAAALLAACVLGVAATAGAVNLISVGAPLPDRTSPRDDYRPAEGVPDIVATAPDRPLPWGVAVYTAANGEPCVLAGQVRGASLGRIENDRFRAYERGTTGACGDVERLGMVIDMLTARGPRPRTVFYGRARASISRVVVQVRGERHVVTPARGGGFILVFEGRVPIGDFDVRPVDSRASGPE